MSIISSKQLLISAFFLFFSSCAPLSQRTTNPNAGRPPELKRHLKENPAIDEKKPFIQIIDGTSVQNYGIPLDKAVKIALRKKPNILFIIETIAPLKATEKEQTEILNHLGYTLAIPISKHILNDGAQLLQIEMKETIDPNLKVGLIKITVQ